MATRAIVPRGDNEGSLGIDEKRWGEAYFGKVDIANGSNSPINTVQRNHVYKLGDVVYSSDMNAKYYLKCIKAGFTDTTTAPDFSTLENGNTITDGSVVWKVCNIGEGSGGGSAGGSSYGMWQPGTAYTVGNIIQSTYAPSEQVFVCITAGMSRNTEPFGANLNIGDVVDESGGGARWLVSSFLPVTGGEMTAPIRFTTDDSGNVGPCVETRAGRKGTLPAEDIYCTMACARDDTTNDSGNAACRYGIFETQIAPTGAVRTYICAFKNMSGSSTNVSIEVGYDANGTAFAKALGNTIATFNSSNRLTFPDGTTMWIG